MNLRSKEPFWLIKDALINSYPSLRENLNTPIIVIGGGITGALISHKLIEDGYKVVLIDRRDVCSGSTAASTAMLQYEVDVPLHQLIEQVGNTNAVASYQNCEKAIWELECIVKTIKSDCDFERKNSVYFTTGKRDVSFLEHEFQARKAHGFEVKWLNESRIKKLGITQGLAAIESKSGAVMNPYKFTQDLLLYNFKKGLKIYDRTEIVKRKSKDEKIVLTTDTGIEIIASHVIHCTGFESVETLSKDIVDLKSTYALISEAYESLPKAFESNIFWDTSSPYLYFRATQDNRIIIGGEDEDFKNATARNKLIPKKEKKLQQLFHKTFRDIEFRMDYSWAGTFGETKDGLPYIGKPDISVNEHYILGFGGNGITFSVMARDAIIASIESNPHPYLEYYKFDR
ncbi:glycine/D-amino acid oxidase-like deaminating enzyme [Ulvibacter sp. MAR_2010_11]|uniref:NAD(P)/FAD-dependent oxidoreductase n=1 Tax=Ulvibacter sp. MAR_2010_11 TaxID=1250229 RepID=UPI000C2C5836|nr:FAD-dependent oxidoreductase [Ulvibacter sp. MAR_2010_11]PKA84248.1 glycine/D-amino acid oxidase-like deaminating enzyme [Ulvibacter sp. MAR_2010_11]